MLREFRDFAMRGNVVDLAVAFVIGAAFGAVVTSLVDDLLMPIVALLIGKPDFSDLTFSISDTVFRYGSFLTALVTFLSIAAAIFFFVVKPITTLQARFASGQQEDKPTRACPECLSDIPMAASRCAFCTAQSAPGT